MTPSNAMLLIFAAVFLVPAAQSCLAIKYSVPPKCNLREELIVHCSYKMIGPTNWDWEITSDHPMFQNLSDYQLDYPTIAVDDCSVQISCAENYNLILFDNNTSVHYNLFQADGFCNPFQRTWQFTNGDELQTFPKNVYATCMEYTVSLCQPNGTKMMLFAVSNDMERSVVESAVEYLSNVTVDQNHFGKSGVLMFDRQMYNSSSITIRGWGGFISNLKGDVLDMLDPSLRFTNSSQGSDFYNRLESYLWNDAFCGSRVIVLMKRYPDERNNTKLIARLKTLRMTVLVFAVTGDSEKDAIGRNMMEQITRETYGFCAFEDNEANLITAFQRLETVGSPYLVYAFNGKKRQGFQKEILPLLYSLKSQNIRILTSISNHGTTSDSRLSVLFDVLWHSYLVESLYQFGGSAFTNRNWAAQGPTSLFFMSLDPNLIVGDYTVTLKYNFTSGWTQNIVFRVFSSSPVSKWLRYDN